MKLSLFQVILMAVFGFAALVGLFVFATHSGKGSNPANAIGPVTIWGTLPKESMTSFLTAAGLIDQPLQSVSYVQKDSTTLASELSSAIAVGNAPDLVLASQEELRALSKYIAPIPSATLPQNTVTSVFIEESKILSAADGYYGVPFLVDPLVLFSNRTILASSGVARPPLTWEALTGLVPAVAQLTPARQITRGLIALGTYDNVRNARGILSSLFLQQGVPVTSYSSKGLAPDLGNSESGGGVSPGKAVLGFYTQFADPTKVSYTWNASLAKSDQAFLSGDLALYLGYASESRFFTAANPNLDFAVSPLPQPATAKFRSAYGLLYSFMIPRGAKNSGGAYQAAILFTNAAEQTAAASATGLAPATLNQLATAPADPVLTVAYAEALYASGWLSPLPSDTDRVFSSMIRDVATGRLDTTTALNSAEQSLGVLLQQ